MNKQEVLSLNARGGHFVFNTMDLLRQYHANTVS